MTRTDYPNITRYRFLFMAFIYSKEFQEVTAVVNAIKKTVQPGHEEYEPLLQAGRERWKEIWTKQEAEDKEVKE